jgi:hypothetical protein
MTLLGDARTRWCRISARAQRKRSKMALLESAKRQDVPRRLKAYERLRIERTSRIQTTARDTGRFFRAEYEDVAERDRLMAKWMATTGWIRGHDAEKAANEALINVGVMVSQPISIQKASAWRPTFPPTFPSQLLAVLIAMTCFPAHPLWLRWKVPIIGIKLANRA